MPAIAIIAVIGVVLMESNLFFSQKPVESTPGYRHFTVRSTPGTVYNRANLIHDCEVSHLAKQPFEILMAVAFCDVDRECLAKIEERIHEVIVRIASACKV